jgi:hypothetical protein
MIAAILSLLCLQTLPQKRIDTKPTVLPWFLYADSSETISLYNWFQRMCQPVGNLLCLITQVCMLTRWALPWIRCCPLGIFFLVCQGTVTSFFFLVTLTSWTATDAFKCAFPIWSKLLTLFPSVNTALFFLLYPTACAVRSSLTIVLYWMNLLHWTN